MRSTCVCCCKDLAGDFQKKFCSKSCAAKTNNRGRQRVPRRPCEHCGTPTKNPKFCSRDCRISARSTTDEHKRRLARISAKIGFKNYCARLLNATPPDVDMQQIRKIYAACPSGYEVDHRIPLTRGGLHHPSNLHYLPALMNRRKGDRLPEECPDIMVHSILPEKSVVGDIDLTIKVSGFHRFRRSTGPDMHGRRRGGMAARDKKVGVHGLTKEQLIEAGRKGGRSKKLRTEAKPKSGGRLLITV